MKNTEEALKWIVKILRDNNIPFQITGGFAAKLYGSMRELADIDINVAEDRLEELAEILKEYSKYGLNHYKDREFDLRIMQLNYMGQDIDITPESVKVYDANKKSWVTLTVDFKNSVEKEIYDLKIPVIPVNELIKYKLILRRDVDLKDVKNLQKLGY